MNDASETLYRLKRVTYGYKKEIDVTQSLDYGLVAEEVASIDPNLVACGKDRQVKTVRVHSGECDVSQRVSKRARGVHPGTKQRLEPSS